MIRNHQRNLLVASLAALALSLGAAQADTPKSPASAIKAIPGNPPPPVGAGSIGVAPLAICAAGFNKTAEQKHIPNGALIRFECTTPVITCPKNPAYTSVSLEVKIINTNPEQSAKQIRYECKYFTPEG